MDGTGWARVQAVFHAAVDIAPAEAQRAYVARACDGDDELAAEVMALLDGDARGQVLVDRDVRDVAGRLWRAGEATGWPALTRVGRYSILRTLGEGGMGIVYLAERDDLGDQVAIKVLRDASLSPARRDRFRVEQRTLALLTHHAIARLYDADTLPDGTPWFAMEYVEGETLDAWCRRGAPTLEERLALFHEICEAVHYAHQRLVVHRDLKPSNILVTPETRVKLLDFGIAKQLDRQDAPVDQTRTTLRLMTPAYAAPEQVRGEPVTTATDVYALGVIAYELLTGQRPKDATKPGADSGPRDGQADVSSEPTAPSVAVRRAAARAAADRAASERASNGAEVIGGDADAAGSANHPIGAAAATTSRVASGVRHQPDEIAARRKTTPTRLARHLSGDLDRVVLKALRPEPERRYASAGQFAEDIDRLLDGRPVMAQPDTLGYRVTRFVTRNRGGVAIGVGLLVLVAAFGAISTMQARALAIERDRARLEASRAQRGFALLSDPFTLADPAEGRGDTITPRALLDRGVERIAAELSGDPESQAALYLVVGRVYGSLALHDTAIGVLAAR